MRRLRRRGIGDGQRSSLVARLDPDAAPPVGAGAPHPDLDRSPGAFARVPGPAPSGGIRRSLAKRRQVPPAGDRRSPNVRTESGPRRTRGPEPLIRQPVWPGRTCMDLFTHVIFAYLLSFVIWGPAAPQYIAAGALAGGLPDADALLFPLARRFPALHHRGAVHSIVGVTLLAAAGSVLVPLLPFFGRGSTLDFFLALEIGGLSHLALDGFTNYAVRPLVPLSQRAIRLDADVAVSAVTMAMTAATLVVLILERGSVAFNLWVETAWILVGVYGAYLLLRAVARLRAGAARDRLGFTELVPSTNPWHWLLVDAPEDPQRYRIRFRRLTLGGEDRSEVRQLDVPTHDPSTGPVDSPAAALARTYGPAIARSAWLARRHHFGEAIERGGVYEVWWYILSQSRGRRAYGVHGEIDRRTGAFRLRAGYLRLPPRSDRR